MHSSSDSPLIGDTSATQPTASAAVFSSLGRSEPRVGRGNAANNIAILAMLYIAAGLVVRLLPLTTYASPIWPAAGVALAVLLICGSGCWPGVWLGAFVVDLLLDLSPAGAALAATSATAATLQALLGASLTRRFLLNPVSLTRDRDLARFLVRAGPLACVVSASIATVVRFLAGQLPLASVPGEWMLWWAGDTIGVLLFAPLVLLAWPTVGAIGRQVGGRRRIALPLLLTASILAAGYLGVARLEEHRARQFASHVMDIIYESALMPLPALIEQLRGMERFLAVSGELNRARFAQYTSLITDQPALLAIEWAPRVTHAERPAFETAAAREYASTFHVSEETPSGSTRLSGSREEYFPVLYAEPAHNAFPLGLDHATLPTHLAAMTRAAGGQAAVAALVRPMGAKESRLLVFQAVSGSPDDLPVTEHGARAQLRGYVIGVFDVERLLAPLRMLAQQEALGYRVSDVTAGEPSVVLSATLPAGAAPTWARAIDFGGREWRLEMQHLPPATQIRVSTEQLIFLGFAVVAASLAAFATLGSAGRHAAINAEVAARTKELERELRLRRAIEAALRAVGDAVITTDRERRVRRLNLAAERLTGWPEAKARGRTIEEVFHIIGDDCHSVLALLIAEVLRTETSRDLPKNAIIITRGGQPRAITGSVAPIVHHGGGPTGVVLAFRDEGRERAAQLELQATLTRYRQLIEAIPLTVIVEFGEQIAYVNPQAVSTFGAQSASDLVGREVLALVHPDSRARVRQHIDLAAAAERRIDLARVDLLRLDGSPFAVEATCVAYLDDERQGSLILVQDITARKEAEEQLDRFFSASLDLLCIFTPQGYFKRVNPAFTECLGWTEEELLREPFLHRIHPDDRCLTLEVVDQIVHGKPADRHVNRYQHKDGRWRTLEWRAPSQIGGLIFASGRDITDQLATALQLQELNTALKLRVEERGAALDALNAMERELRAVLDNLVECVVTIDQRGIIRSVNRAIESVFGYRVEELIGRNVSVLMPEPHRSRHDDYLARYARTGQARIIGSTRAVEGRHKDGHPIALELWITALEVNGEELYVGMLRDIRERKALIADLIEAREAAEQASRAKSAFLAAMSHEIRTPMNGIIGLVDVLAKAPVSDEQADLLGTIQESSSTLLRIIDDILDFSKIEAGSLKIEHEPLCITDLVEGVCDSLVHFAIRQDVDLTVFVAPEIPNRVLSDELRLRQILNNLICNAIKFSGRRTNQRGRVAVRVTVAHANPLRLALSVTDNGIGIANDRLKKVFDPFVQAEASTTRRYGGTGLGLAITQRLVNKMQGEISVRSEFGTGSNFTVTLPFETAVDQPSATWPDLAGLRCILVAGETFDVDDFRAYLKVAGGDVRVAEDDTDHFTTDDSMTVVIAPSSHGGSLDESFPVGLRRVVIGRGRRRGLRITGLGAVMVDGNALRRHTLLTAVALAAGRASPDSISGETNEPTAPDVQRPPTVEEARAQGRLILVAEDDEVNQKVLLRQLALLGHAGAVAHNGLQALDMWRQGGYALLLTDLHMPDMDGYSLAGTVRREEDGRTRTPILALSADAQRSSAHRALAAGIDEYLSKPIRLDMLSAALDKWLPPENAAPGSAARPAPTPAVEPTPARMLFDRAVLRQLVGDEPTMVRGILDDFRRSLTRQAAQLNGAVTAGNLQELSAISHRLKSSCRSVGALGLGEVCAGLEKAGEAGDRAAIASGIEQFKALVEHAQAEIGAILDSDSP